MKEKPKIPEEISELASVVSRILDWTIYLLVRHVPKVEMEGIDAEIEILREKLNKFLR